MKIKLKDNNALDVIDSKFDLLFHLFNKNKFDKGKINEEIEWVCKNNESNNIEYLLKISLQQYSSELLDSLSKKINFADLSSKDTETYFPSSGSGVQYTIAENATDMRKVLELRKQVFVNEENYPVTAITNGFEKESLHIMAYLNKELIGVVSVAFDGAKGMPLEKYLSLVNYKNGKKNVEVDKLAVLGVGRKREISFQLMWLCYSIARFWGAQAMFIFTLSRRPENVVLYRKFGFKIIDHFNLFAEEEATALKLDFNDIDTYEKKLKTNQMLKLGKKLLNKFALHG